MGKKFKSVIRHTGKDSRSNAGSTKAPNSPANVPTEEKGPLEGSELFSFFTANIIKERKVFTR